MELTAEQQKYLDDTVKASLSGVKDKNKELMGKLKAVTEKLNGFDGIDLKQLNKDSKELAKLKKTKDENEGNYKKLYDQQTEQHTKEKADLIAERDNAISTTHKLQKKTKLQVALTKHHVDPILADAAQKLLIPEVNLTDDGEAMVGDKTVDAYVEDWAVSDVGKRFVTDGHSGGGAGGPGGKGPSGDAKYFEKGSKDYNLTEQARIEKANPAKYAKLAKLYKK